MRPAIEGNPAAGYLVYRVPGKKTQNLSPGGSGRRRSGDEDRIAERVT